MTLDTVLGAIVSEVGNDSLSFYHPSKDFIITDTAIDAESVKKITVD